MLTSYILDFVCSEMDHWVLTAFYLDKSVIVITLYSWNFGFPVRWKDGTTVKWRLKTGWNFGSLIKKCKGKITIWLFVDNLSMCREHDLSTILSTQYLTITSYYQNAATIRTQLLSWKMRGQDYTYIMNHNFLWPSIFIYCLSAIRPIAFNGI